MLHIMARENIGTKSTRAYIIDILKSHSYINSHKNGALQGTELGIVVT
jgi:DNA topoisomerase IA